MINFIESEEYSRKFLFALFGDDGILLFKFYGKHSASGIAADYC